MAIHAKLIRDDQSHQVCHELWFNDTSHTLFYSRKVASLQSMHLSSLGSSSVMVHDLGILPAFHSIASDPLGIGAICGLFHHHNIEFRLRSIHSSAWRSRQTFDSALGHALNMPSHCTRNERQATHNHSQKALFFRKSCGQVILSLTTRACVLVLVLTCFRKCTPCALHVVVAHYVRLQVVMDFHPSALLLALSECFLHC